MVWTRMAVAAGMAGGREGGAPAHVMAPVTLKDREYALDVVRGVAVLGILAVNMQAFAMPFWAYLNPLAGPFPLEGQGATVWFATHVFFELKFITLFSMLFGASIFMLGGERRDPERSPILRRRLMWLLLFGLAHGLLLWYGDILFVYALCGFLVLLARSWRPGTLIIVGSIWFAVSLFLGWGLYASLFLAPPEVVEEVAREWLPAQEVVAANIAAYRGSYADWFAANAFVWSQVQIFSLPVLLPRTVGVMMIGMALFKLGFFTNRAPVWVYVAGVVAGTAALAVIWLQAAHNLGAGFPFPETPSNGTLPNLALSIFVTLGYVSLLMLLLRGGLLPVLGYALSCVGRMAFTNYLTQTLMMTFLFYGWGLGWFATVDRPQQAMIVGAVWLLQLVWSPLWLGLFRMGPFEWVWRTLTYGRFQPLIAARA